MRRSAELHSRLARNRECLRKFSLAIRLSRLDSWGSPSLIMKFKLANLLAFLLFLVTALAQQDKPTRVFIRAGVKTCGM